MRRGFLVGAIVGALGAAGLGLGVALVPTTPTWALLQIARAADSRDTEALLELIDVPTLAMRTLGQIGSDPNSALGTDDPSADAGTALLQLMNGGRIRTALDDPKLKLRVGPLDLLSAWWTMHRAGPDAVLTLETGTSEVHIVLREDAELRWRIVGISPLNALIRVDSSASVR